MEGYPAVEGGVFADENPEPMGADTLDAPSVRGRPGTRARSRGGIVRGAQPRGGPKRLAERRGEREGRLLFFRGRGFGFGFWFGFAEEEG